MNKFFFSFNRKKSEYELYTYTRATITDGYV